MSEVAVPAFTPEQLPSYGQHPLVVFDIQQKRNSAKGPVFDIALYDQNGEHTMQFKADIPNRLHRARMLSIALLAVTTADSQQNDGWVAIQDLLPFERGGYSHQQAVRDERIAVNNNLKKTSAAFDDIIERRNDHRYTEIRAAKIFGVACTLRSKKGLDRNRF